MAYAYLMASLPLLAIGKDIPMSSEDFLAYCEPLLSEKDAQGLKAAMEGRLAEVDHPAVRKYLAAETQLRDAVARLRAAKAGIDPSPFLRPFADWDSLAEKTAAEAMGAVNPLERELILDKYRWHVLEDLAALDAFGMVAVYSYGLRLQIAEKWLKLNESQGEAAVTTIVEDNVAGIGL